MTTRRGNLVGQFWDPSEYEGVELQINTGQSLKKNLFFFIMWIFSLIIWIEGL